MTRFNEKRSSKLCINRYRFMMVYKLFIKFWKGCSKLQLSQSVQLLFQEEKMKLGAMVTQKEITYFLVTDACKLPPVTDKCWTKSIITAIIPTHTQTQSQLHSYYSQISLSNQSNKRKRSKSPLPQGLQLSSQPLSASCLHEVTPQQSNTQLTPHLPSHPQPNTHLPLHTQLTSHLPSRPHCSVSDCSGPLISHSISNANPATSHPSQPLSQVIPCMNLSIQCN